MQLYLQQEVIIGFFLWVLIKVWGLTLKLMARQLMQVTQPLI